MLRKSLLRNFMFLVLLLVASTACKGQNRGITGAVLKTYAIVQPDNPSDMEKKAVSEFRSYFQKSTGILLPVTSRPQARAFYIGNSNALKASMNYSGIANDGYFIRSKGEDIYIGGSGEKGVLYGVYTFLERVLHITMLEPGSFDMPQVTALDIPQNLNITENPRFIHREIYNNIAMDPLYTDWYKMNHMMKNPQWGLLYHTSFILFPPSKYFSAHPDYYSLVNGSRSPQQLCYSNEALNKELPNVLTSYFNANRGAVNWWLSQEDANVVCECDLCRKKYAQYGGAPSGLLIEFVNRIARLHPEKIFFTLAYDKTLKPPTGIRPEKNVVVCYAPMDASHNLGYLQDPGNKQYVDWYKGWAKICPNMMFWDYWSRFDDPMMPYPNFQSLKNNMKFFAANGVKYLYAEEVIQPVSDFKALKTYLVAKLMWNPDENLDQLITGFCNKYYGAAAPAVMNYLNLRNSNAVSAKSVLRARGRGTKDYRTSFLKPEMLRKYDAILSEAEAKAGNNQVIQQRVAALRAGIDYLILEAAGAKKMPLQPAEQKNRAQRLSNTLRTSKSTYEDYFDKAAIPALK